MHTDAADFYSRPCGRGDAEAMIAVHQGVKFLLTPLREGRLITSLILRYLQKEFLLTPLREGRRNKKIRHIKSRLISTHAPAGGATLKHFLPVKKVLYFYSRPCGRGDSTATRATQSPPRFLLTPLREGRQPSR